MDASPARIAVIGGGYAGMAAAVTLVGAGRKVVVLETAKTLGGRARRVETHGHAIDNGQHILLGAYAQTLALLHTVHGDGDARVLLRTRLHLEQPGSFRLSAPRLPAPLHLGLALLRARGLDLRARIATVDFVRRLKRQDFRCDPLLTVAGLLAGEPRSAVRLLWEPLCIAALNTPVAAASAQIYLNVLRAAFARTARDSDLLLPVVDLSTLFPEPAAAWLARHGSEVRMECRVDRVVPGETGVRIEARGADHAFAAAVIAVAPHQFSGLFGADAPHGMLASAMADIARFAYEPICTVYLRFPRRLSLSRPLLKLDDAPGQWVFDREQLGGPSGLAAVVISTDLPGPKHDHASLAREVEAQLKRFWPDLPRPEWNQVITEQRATYACVAGLARPLSGTLGHNLYLAGDYTDAEFPGTIEAAVRSGVRAAQALLTGRTVQG